MIASFLKKKQHTAILCLKSLALVFKETPWQVSLLLLGILLQGIAPTLTIGLSAHLVNVIAKPALHTHTSLWQLCILWAGSLLLMNCITPFVICWQGNIADKAVNKINRDIIKKANAMQNLAYFETPEFYNDIQVLQSQAINKPLNLVVTCVGLARDCITVISCLALLGSVIPWISLLALLSAYVNFKVYAILQAKTWEESLGRSLESRKLAYISSLTLNAQYVKELRFFDFGAFLFNEYARIFAKIYAKMRKLRGQQACWPFAPFAVTVIGNLFAFFMVANLAYHGKMQLGTVVLFLQTLSQLHLSISLFGEQAGWIQGHVLFFEKFFTFIRLKENIFPISNPKLLLFTNEFSSVGNNFCDGSKFPLSTTDRHALPAGGNPAGWLKRLDSRLRGNDDLREGDSEFSIAFDHIEFSYDDKHPILCDINFSIQPKEKIAIVGINGAGKSTLIKLLCGLYAPTAGEIRINDIPLQNLDLPAWRKKIAPVFQDFNGYAFSMERNICMEEAEANAARLRMAANQSGVTEFASLLPNGLQTLLGKDFGGIDLSKGQWQRIAIARALYKDAPILILDEPSASLDPITEYEIFNRLIASAAKKTLLFVTHRLSTLMFADRILFFNSGKLAADGTHASLMQNCESYREMFDKQSAGYFALNQQVFTNLPEGLV